MKGDTLVAVVPPSDWIGLALVAAMALLAVALICYTVWARRKTGAQFGEVEMEKLAAYMEKRGAPPTRNPLEVDGYVFADAASVEEYLAAKAVLAKYGKG